MNTDPGRLCQLLTRLRTRLTSHLAHEESEALPLLATIMSHGEVGQINRAICGGRLGRRAALTLPWALASVTPVVRARVLGELPAPGRLLCRAVCCRAIPATPSGLEDRQICRRSRTGADPVRGRDPTCPSTCAANYTHGSAPSEMTQKGLVLVDRQLSRINARAAPDRDVLGAV